MSAQQIQPLRDKVLVKRLRAQKSKGGILLPDSAQEKPRQGHIEAVGPGRRDAEGNLQPLELQVGDRVLFSSYAGTEVEVAADPEAEYLILGEEDVLGILQGEDA